VTDPGRVPSAAARAARRHGIPGREPTNDRVELRRRLEHPAEGGSARVRGTGWKSAPDRALASGTDASDRKNAVEVLPTRCRQHVYLLITGPSPCRCRVARPPGRRLPFPPRPVLGRSTAATPPTSACASCAAVSRAPTMPPSSASPVAWAERQTGNFRSSACPESRVTGSGR